MFDLKDIQGNILRGYRSFPHARFLYLEITDAKAAKTFLKKLVVEHVITPAEWREKPRATTNIGITMVGLRALELPSEILGSFPHEFQQGMRLRASRLGDVDGSDPTHWDEPWRSGVHLVLMCYSGSGPHLEAHCQLLRGKLPNGIAELPPAQDAAVLTVNGRPRVEHFGFVDGLSNPDIEGVPGESTSTGNVDANGKFREVPVGEFLLGHRGEGGEVAPMPRPPLLVHNGTFLVLRKLHQNVAAFRSYLAREAADMQNVIGRWLPPKIDPEDYLAAKMMGRWHDGSPVDLYPDNDKANHKTNAFTYAGDVTGARCPLGAHVRRANPRDSLGFSGHIISRRRMIRRGITYGDFLPKGSPDDNASRGIMFLAFNSSIERQFEFVQNQWINYGDEFLQGDDADPIAGARLSDGRMVDAGPHGRTTNAKGRMMIPGDERTGRIPYLCSGIPSFVTTKGGDYFFVPSMTGLRLLASERVDV
jgi:Dyp-type peroxidase family